MNRPVLGTVSILALLGGGLYFAWTYKDSTSQSPPRPYQGAAARSALQAWLDLPLPASATDVHCSMEVLERTQLVYARFDIPPIELPSLFDQQRRFPESTRWVADASLLQSMGALADPQRPWWEVDKIPGAVGAQKSGTRNVAPATLKWRVQVCAASLSPSLTRVYIAFLEEPAEAK